MLARLTVLGLLAAAAAAMPVAAEAPSFERRVVAILNAGGAPETVQSRLDRVGTGMTLSPEQRVAIEAVQTMVRGRLKAKGPSLTEAEAFAARNPGSPASSILLAEAALANEQPGRSADTLIAAAASAGTLFELVSPAMVSRLTAELDDQADRTRTALLAKALLDAGWSRGSASLRSFLAMAAIRDELESGQVVEARRFLPNVVSPAWLHLIVIDNRFEPLRAEALERAGPRLAAAWQSFLIAARDEWAERGDVLSAAAYAEALKQANQHEALVDAFLSRFMRGYNCPDDYVARALADDLASSLARIGRWSRAEDVIRRSGGVSAPVYASMLLERGEFGRAQALFARSLKAAGEAENAKEQKATAWLRAAADCAAVRGGRPAASGYDPKLLDVSARMFVLLCTGRDEDAQATLLAALEDAEERADALRWVQPFADPPAQSEFRKQMSVRMRAVQSQTAVVAAVARYGVLLDWPLTAAVPAGAELAAGAKGPAWQCGDEAQWELVSGQETIQIEETGR